MSQFKELLASEFAPYGSLSADQLAALENHYNLLTAWNRKLNLTRILDLREVIQFHYCESLYVARFLPVGSLKIADVGSGAGFPGIPIAIYRPDCEVDLIEADQRKAVFLRESSRSHSNVSVIAERAENIRNRYDWVVTRAVRSEDILSLRLSRSVAILGTWEQEREMGLQGRAFHVEHLPWGENRLLFHVEQKSHANI